MELHVYLHLVGDPRLDQILTSLAGLTAQGERLMALGDDLKAGIVQLRDETDAVAANIAQLAGRIKNTLTDQEVADIKSALSAESDRLVTLAVDPTAPVPAVPPQLANIRRKK